MLFPQHICLFGLPPPTPPTHLYLMMFDCGIYLYVLARMALGLMAFANTDFFQAIYYNFTQIHGPHLINITNKKQRHGF